MIPLANLARSLAEKPRAVTLFGAPEGHDAATIGALLADGEAVTWLHVCRDDGRMARFAAALGFFHPELAVLTFPAWDCLPYDRVSPNGEITSRRIDTLTRLAGGVPARSPPPRWGRGWVGVTPLRRSPTAMSRGGKSTPSPALPHPGGGGR